MGGVPPTPAPPRPARPGPGGHSRAFPGSGTMFFKFLRSELTGKHPRNNFSKKQKNVKKREGTSTRPCGSVDVRPRYSISQANIGRPGNQISFIFNKNSISNQRIPALRPSGQISFILNTHAIGKQTIQILRPQGQISFIFNTNSIRKQTIPALMPLGQISFIFNTNSIGKQTIPTLILLRPPQFRPNWLAGVKRIPLDQGKSQNAGISRNFKEFHRNFKEFHQKNLYVFSVFKIFDEIPVKFFEIP